MRSSSIASFLSSEMLQSRSSTKTIVKLLNREIREIYNSKLIINSSYSKDYFAYKRCMTSNCRWWIIDLWAKKTQWIWLECCFFNVWWLYFKKRLFSMFRLIGVNWPPNSCSFQIIVFVSMWLKSKWTEWIWPGNTSWLCFYRDSIVTTWFKTALENLDNSLSVKVEKYVKIKTFESRITVFF